MSIIAPPPADIAEIRPTTGAERTSCFSGQWGDTWRAEVEKVSEQWMHSIESQRLVMWSDIASFIDHLKGMKDDWNSYGSPAPNEVACRLAREVGNHLAYLLIEPKSVAASAEGGIGMSFKNDSRYADIEIFNDGEILAVTMDGDGEPKVWEVIPETTEIRKALRLIREFIE